MSAISIARPILRWYDQHRRSLPWRALRGEIADPYRVWLSEIMLQQTTVAAVIPYFQKFTEKWANIDALAAAPQDEIMTAWAGLGYYSRARNLLACAQQVRDEFHGQFPKNVNDLIKLPGIGPYTAAAIAAIAYDLPANVVDGNVERVMARLFAIKTPLPQAKPELIALAAGLVPTKRTGDYAQALMDLGATICTPKSPACPSCPLRAQCQAKALDIAASLPMRSKVKPRPVKQALVFVLEDKTGRLWLRRRPDKGLLGGMLEFPSSPWLTRAPHDLATELATLLGVDKTKTAQWQTTDIHINHVFTHFELGLTLVCGKSRASGPAGLWLWPQEADENALPSVMKKVLAAYQRYKSRTE